MKQVSINWSNTTRTVQFHQIIADQWLIEEIDNSAINARDTFEIPRAYIS